MMKWISYVCLLSLSLYAENFKPSWSLQQKADYYNLVTIQEHLEMFEDANAYDGNEINAYDMLRLMIATGNLDNAIYLLNHGCDINGYDSKGYTPLINAIIHKQEEIISYLLNHGAILTKNAQNQKSLWRFIQESGSDKIKALVPVKIPKSFRFTTKNPLDLKIYFDANSITLEHKNKLIKHFSFVNEQNSALIVLDFETQNHYKMQNVKLDHPKLNAIKLGWHYDFYRIAFELKAQSNYRLQKEDTKTVITLAP